VDQAGFRKGHTTVRHLHLAFIDFNKAFDSVELWARLDWDKNGLRVDDGYLSNLRFADDIVLISSTKQELNEMLADLKRESGKSV